MKSRASISWEHSELSVRKNHLLPMLLEIELTLNSIMDVKWMFRDSYIEIHMMKKFHWFPVKVYIIRETKRITRDCLKVVQLIKIFLALLHP